MRALLMISAAAAMVSASPAKADEPSARPAAVVQDAELDKLRGGFITVTGLTLHFGAVVRSYVNDQLALQTDLTVNGAGAQLSQTAGRGYGPVAPETLSALSAAGINLAGVRGAQAVAVTPDGATAFVHNFSQGALSNLLVNTGSDKSFRQETDVTLTLPGFEAVQGQMAAALTAGNLVSSMNQMTMR
jgi:hypothetical protein